MAKEILAIPEHLLNEIILVIRAGLFFYGGSREISDETRDNLKQWCEDMIEHLGRLETKE